MSENPPTSLEAARVRRELAKHDPSLASADLHDPDTVLALFRMAAALKGEPISFEKTRPNGDVETLHLDFLGFNDEGLPIINASVTTTGDDLSPQARSTLETIRSVSQPHPEEA